MKKRIITFALAVMLGLGAAVFAGPFVGFDFTIPNDGILYFGVETGSLTLELSVCDLFLYDADEDAIPPTLTFKAEHFTEFSYWDSKFNYRIEEIDFVSTYPIPIADGMVFSWCGTLHVGELAESLAELPQTFSSTFDIYGKVSFEYEYSTSQLIPTGSFGFYWDFSKR